MKNKKKNNLLKQGIVIGLMVLFVGASVVTSIGGNTVQFPQITEAKEDYSDMVSKEEQDPGRNPRDDQWSQTFGGPGGDHGSSVDQTTDGGYIITGTQMYYVDPRWYVDAWLIKTNSDGTEQWSKTFGGKWADEGYSVQQTTDGGYIITGSTESNPNPDFDPHIGNVWLIKTDADGNESWSRAYGGVSRDVGYSVQQTLDGGYIITGYTMSYGIEGTQDVWLIKTDQSGIIQWDKTFGGNMYEIGHSVQQTNDLGYIITGKKLGDVWLIKTDANGDELWNKTFGGDKADRGYSVKQTTDGGYIITGQTDGSYPDIGGDLWLIKTDINGNEQWNKTFGGGKVEIGYSVDQTNDGGYIITGITGWYTGGADGDVWIIKTDADGNETWNIIYGGSEYDAGKSVQQTTDGGYIVTGTTGNYNYNCDAFLIKIGSSGNHPPYKPSDPFPEDGATEIDVDTNPRWTSGDPDPNDTVTYDVYFGTTSPPPKVISNQSATTYDPETLNYETTYYWKIVAWDEYGASNTSEEWQFTTEEWFEPDLDCDGSLSWTGVEPGSIVEGSFTVENNGEPGSELDWEISEIPRWGTWMFTPSSGNDLTPENGAITVEVSVIAPDESEKEFSGEIKVVNSENPDDFCTIDVSLATPVNHNSIFTRIIQFLQNFIEQFPMLEKILSLFPIFSRLLNL